MEVDIAVLLGDGVGPEATAEALNVLEAVGEKFDHRLSFSEGLVGGAAVDIESRALSYETLCVVAESA